MTTELKVRTWLLALLGAVVILGGGYTYYSVKGFKGTTPKKSPSPTISPTKLTASPTKGTTSTPTSQQTSTPAATPTSTATPNTTPPTGWKLETNKIEQGGGNVVSASYQLFIKNSWTARPDSAFATWPNRIQYYGDDQYCGTSVSDPNYKAENCLFNISGGAQINDANHHSYAIPNSEKYLIIEFNQAKPLSESDKNIILNSFQVL